MLLCLSFSPLSHAATVTLAWDPPASGTVTGYKLYRGTATQNYTTVTTLGSQPQTVVNDLVAGTRYYFAVKAYNSSGESAFSNELAYTVPTTTSNTAPVAQNGSISTTVNISVTGSLRATDADGNTLTYSLVTTGSKGKATLTSSLTGAFKYVPNSGVTGTDTFTFRANDGKVNSNTATITVTINPANRAPTATNSSISTIMNKRAYNTLRASDPDGNSLTYTIVTNGTLGQAVIRDAKTGDFYYAPYWNRTGSDSFTFRVSDGKLYSGVAKVSVTITTSGTTSAVRTSSVLSEPSPGSGEGLSDEMALLLEAEDGEIRGPMTLQPDPDASGGAYLEVSAGDTSRPAWGEDAGTAEYVFDVPVSGTYAIWGRVQSRDSLRNGFYLRVDSQPFVNWEPGLGGDGTWIWSSLKKGNDAAPLLLTLEEGRHVLTLKQKDEGARIDRILVTARSNHFGSTLYEDAEDRATHRWRILPGSLQGAEVRNVFDEGCGSRVIELSGTGMDNKYRLMTDDLKFWSDESRTVLEWSMKSSAMFSVLVDVETAEGPLRLVYSPTVREIRDRNGLIHLGLGSDAADGRWHTFVRDLQADLQGARPRAAITRVNGFAVRGGGRIDNVQLRYPD